jgi:predicted NUDIX family NTP pyrophosphohydrolase
MPKRSAGILLFRRRPSGLEVLLAHPGGPFFKKKDLGAWTIPKGEIEEEEDPLAAARREFREETGCSTDGPFLDLGEIRQKSGKRVLAWAAEGDADTAGCSSISFSMEWPPRSGRSAEFPEVDRWEWFGLEEATRRINPAQSELIERLRARVG